MTSNVLIDSSTEPMEAGKCGDDRNKAYLACPKRPGCLMQQLQFSGLEEWLPEFAAAEYLGSDTPTLRDLRSGHWKGITPFRECGGEYFYLRVNLDGWLSNNARRNAGNPSGIFLI